MTIGIIGSGSVGGSLGTHWTKKGHQVVFGSRDPGASDITELLARAGKKASAATVAEAARQDVLLLATPWPATQEILSGLGDLSGKILIDATNPLLPDLSGVAVGTTTSGGEQVASWAAGAKVVKAFNTVGNNIMADSSFEAGKPVLFYCGDDASAKKTVRQLAEDIGFDAQDAGPLKQARLLEPFALLWISLAFQQRWGREFAFKVMRR
ncbi:MAG TPA: NADPH-dependent F420 reductase [Bryobacteraceae bacterium]